MTKSRGPEHTWWHDTVLCIYKVKITLSLTLNFCLTCFGWSFSIVQICSRYTDTPGTAMQQVEKHWRPEQKKVSLISVQPGVWRSPDAPVHVVCHRLPVTALNPDQYKKLIWGQCEQTFTLPVVTFFWLLQTHWLTPFNTSRYCRLVGLGIHFKMTLSLIVYGKYLFPSCYLIFVHETCCLFQFIHCLDFSWSCMYSIWIYFNKIIKRGNTSWSLIYLPFLTLID